MGYDPTVMKNYTTACDGFTEHYAGTPPWDIGRPQAPFITYADLVRSPLLDVGCGTGGTAVYFAGRGLTVTGVDFVEQALHRAQQRAEAHGVSVDFVLKDAMTLSDWDARFDTVIDSGLYHVYADQNGLRQQYLNGLAHVLRPEGRLLLLTFTDQAREGGVSRQLIEGDFARGWAVEMVTGVQGEVNPAFLAEHPDAYPAGGPPMWFAVIRRLG